MSFYTPNREAAESGGRAPEGEYAYQVEQADEKTFSTRNSGVALMLLVAIGDRDVKVFENLVDTPAAQWRIKQFMESINCDYMNPPPLYQIPGKRGRAKFVVGDNGYLEVEEFLPASASNGPGRAPQEPPTRMPRGNEPPPLTDDDVPY